MGTGNLPYVLVARSLKKGNFDLLVNVSIENYGDLFKKLTPESLFIEKDVKYRYRYRR